MGFNLALFRGSREDLCCWSSSCVTDLSEKERKGGPLFLPNPPHPSCDLAAANATTLDCASLHTEGIPTHPLTPPFNPRTPPTSCKGGGRTSVSHLHTTLHPYTPDDDDDEGVMIEAEIIVRLRSGRWDDQWPLCLMLWSSLADRFPPLPLAHPLLLPLISGLGIWRLFVVNLAGGHRALCRPDWTRLIFARDLPEGAPAQTTSVTIPPTLWG
ncbi:hypothetical protein CEXT_245381 [Caerostris extrusa]|uniref:Uncharacterized protein n=1 Tax=Caerostris extrusa TaxID=172846 RepID=A0AAV4YBY4_CAEEX|nr:hypothetical protein CEXT_245381 [Caerostris extrusa]